MAVTLQPMPPADIGPWLDQGKADHIADRVDTGEPPETARRITNAISDSLFPGGVPTPNQLVFHINEDNIAVGSLWIGVGLDGPPDVWWVWSIEIHPSARGHGIGRRALKLGEDVARAGGATKLELNVFGTNSVARSLYESLGYRTVNIHMSKLL